MGKAIKAATLHAKVEAAKADVERIEKDLQAAHAAVGALSARRGEVQAELAAAREAVATGRNPDRPVTELKNALADLEEDIETARAKVAVIERSKAAVAPRVGEAEDELRRAQRQWCEARGKGIRERMDVAARALQEAQFSAVALARGMTKRGMRPNEVNEIVSTHLLFAEISSGTGGATTLWPLMGDRKIDDTVIAQELAELHDALENL